MFLRVCQKPRVHFLCTSIHSGLLRRSSAGTRVKASVAKGSPSPGDIIKPEERSELVSRNEEGVTKWVLKTFARHLWPDSPEMKARVAIALSFLVGSKVVFLLSEHCAGADGFQILNVQVPFLFKEAIDALQPMTAGEIGLATAIPVSILLGCMLYSFVVAQECQMVPPEPALRFFKSCAMQSSLR